MGTVTRIAASHHSCDAGSTLRRGQVAGTLTARPPFDKQYPLPSAGLVQKTCRQSGMPAPPCGQEMNRFTATLAMLSAASCQRGRLNAQAILPQSSLCSPV